MNYRFHHIHLLCSDLEKTIDFFTGILGATLLARKKFGAADGAALDLNGSAVLLRVAAENEAVNTPAEGPAYGYHHLALSVDDTDAAYQRLGEQGVDLIAPPRNTPDGLRVAFFKGPDKIVFELVQTL
ncbi:Glyoxalase/bleomycin resistance protein/dioxygenase [Desulfosarcina cetonica]|uniref:VOC family protein n=1 Tax=Desulfosarcina cetonica TaxID=90730 RepID=UPI0006D027C3|nr:VOC family protein [Desulfosarcina cetonica]VTR70279.1 Glyoxalase/bleomycin resistance protein/dioxygenase [Desulfosarcina cetonica]